MKQNNGTRVIVGKGSCGIAAGANRISTLLEKGIRDAGIDCSVVTTGCIGMCYLEPVVDVLLPDGSKETYVRVDADGAGEILKSIRGEANNAEQYKIPREDAENLHKQTRVALANCGVIDPESIDEYIAKDGYKTVTQTMKTHSPEDIIAIIKESGLAGRGGAGFPTWFKWQAARNSPYPKDGIKYVICNADEGDPGAFMDRAVLEGDPHALIEGMLMAAYAIGAREGVVYVRAEYPLAIHRLENAIAQAEERGFLGDDIQGTGFGFRLRIKAGAGAFVCGEETALIASLEGERGMPRLKPPFPAQKGLWQKPSNINNVETYANVPWIIRNGGQAFAAMGTENSKGTKVFALTGKIKKGGLVEIPMGNSIRDVIYGVGGGIKEDKAFKAVQMGGPSGGCIPAELIDTLIDYRTLAATGAIMGSGGMVVMDETTCMVDMARFFLDFTCKESCGKCVHCRIGTKRMLEILTRITEGEGRDGDIELLSDLAVQIKDGSLCGLGQTAPNPVLTTIKYFRNEYEDHIYHKKCTAKQCKPLLRYAIDKDACTGCTLCSRKCPVEAISGQVKQPHTIDPEVCIKCGKCAEVCRFKAVVID
ncbi:NADH-quinone oxidoreductase subunit NuoF [Ruminococcaceae bacterium OttesenSCG-928-L11]|nr:NADH-quinone oxidoreductase subunit NuoF [Ruminococcaceae bacterium OttesenSCG-928-L11]